MASLLSLCTPRLLRKTAFVSFATALVVAALVGCVAQQNGDRCDLDALNSGNSDCDLNLYCTAVGDPTGIAPLYACCPATGSGIAPEGICASEAYNGLDAAAPDAGSKADAGSPDATLSDASEDGTSEDGASDAADDTAPALDGAPGTDAGDAAAIPPLDAAADSGSVDAATNG